MSQPGGNEHESGLAIQFGRVMLRTPDKTLFEPRFVRCRGAARGQIRPARDAKWAFSWAGFRPYFRWFARLQAEAEHTLG
jgi:hypothetical protein